MNLLRSAALLAVALPASALRGPGRILDGGLLPDSDIIVDRPEAIFKQEYEIGATYMEHIEMDQDSKISLGGIDMDQKVTMHMDVECAVSEVAEPVGGREVTMTFEDLDFCMNAGEITMCYDSKNPNDPGANNPAFKPLADMVGHSMTIITDEDGKVVEASEHEELMKKLGGAGGGAAAGPPGAGQNPVQDMASPKQFEQMSRMAKAVPADRAIKPGDEWDVDDLEMDGAMVFSGTGSFPGFRMHKDDAGEEHEVAVFAIEGSFDMDLEKMGDILELELDEEEGSGEDAGVDENAKAAMEAAKSVKIKGGRMTVTLYWDNEDGLIRWMELTQSMTMEMPNPVDPTGVLEIPTEQVVKTSVDKK